MRIGHHWLVLLLLGAAGAAFAQETDGEIARQTSDPTSDLWLVYTELTFSQMPGSSFETSNAATLELQPSLPVTLNPGLRLLNFPELVLATQGRPDGRQVTGVETFSWMAALSPASPQMGFSWGLGPLVSFPVSTNASLGESLWQFGGGGVIAWRSENFVLSALVKSGWTTSGGDQAGALQIQYNIQHFFWDGMQVGLGRPTVEYTWNRCGGGTWDVPVGVDVGRVFRIGKMPLKILLEYDFFIVNDSRWEPEHLLRLTFVPVFSSPITDR